MLYLDTSLLVSAVSMERLSPAVRDWLSDNADEELLISGWGSTEVAAALSMNLRMGVLDQVSRAKASRSFGALAREALRVVDVARADFKTAAHLAERHETGLRAGDALHLAVAARHGATLCTLDVRQAEAGRALGIDTSVPVGQE